VKLDTVERWLHWAGGAGTLAFAIAMYLGLWRGSRRPKGRISGPAPVVVQGLTSSYLLPASVLGSAVLYILWRPLRLPLTVRMRLTTVIIGAILHFSGLALMLWGRFTLGQMYSVSSSLGTELYADHRLVTSGPFARVRHPMYLGGQLAEIGALLLYRTWATLLVTLNIPVLFLRARQEEHALAAEFGDCWVDYSRQVPFWIPRIR